MNGSGFAGAVISRRNKGISFAQNFVQGPGYGHVSPRTAKPVSGSFQNSLNSVRTLPTAGF